jgi:hypothetical protein
MLVANGSTLMVGSGTLLSDGQNQLSSAIASAIIVQ